MTAAEPFGLYSRYYDLLYRNKDYGAEVRYLAALLRRHGVAGGDLLEFGSGTGGHGKLLGAQGYRILGVERSAEMVALAGETDGFGSIEGDIRTVRLGRSFSAVLALFHVVSYQTDDASLLDTLRSAAVHLAPGSPFVFDFWHAPAVYSQRPEVRVRRMSDDKVHVTRIAEPVMHAAANRVDVGYTIFVEDRASGVIESFSESHPMRCFSLPEIDQLATATGFERVAAEAFLTGEPPGLDSWGVCAVLRRL